VTSPQADHSHNDPDGEPRDGSFCDGHCRRLHKKDGVINDDGTQG